MGKKKNKGKGSGGKEDQKPGPSGQQQQQQPPQEQPAGRGRDRQADRPQQPQPGKSYAGGEQQQSRPQQQQQPAGRGRGQQAHQQQQPPPGPPPVQLQGAWMRQAAPAQQPPPQQFQQPPPQQFQQPPSQQFQQPPPQQFQQPPPQQFRQPPPQQFQQPVPQQFQQPYTQQFQQPHPQQFRQRHPQQVRQSRPQHFQQPHPQQFQQPYPQQFQQPYPQQFQQQPRGWGPPPSVGLDSPASISPKTPSTPREFSMSPEVHSPGGVQQLSRPPSAWQSPQASAVPSPAPSSQGTPPLSREASLPPPETQEQQPTQKGKRQRKPRKQADKDVPLSPAESVSSVRQERPATGAVPRQTEQQQAGGDQKKQETLPPQQVKEVGGGEASKGVAEIEQMMGKIAIRHGGGVVPLIRPQERNEIRKGGTKYRKKITVLTNHFPLSLGKVNRAIHYDVNIVPDKPKKLFRSAMEAFRLAYYKNRYPAFDGMKNLYSAFQLCTGELTGKVKVREDDRDREFEITIKQVAYVDLSCLNNYFQDIGRQNLDKPMQALQCIDIILRSAPSLNCIPAGRSYFNIPVGQTIQLGDGTELFNGFYQSAILGWKPFLNVDVAHKAFPMQMFVEDYIKEISRNANPGRQLDYTDIETLQKHMRQLKVQYEIPKVAGSKRIWRVNGLGDPPNVATFKDDKGRVSTVENYFTNEKRVRLRYPNWPTLWVGSLNRENKILLPLEFCMILRGQAVNKKMTEMQTRNMIRHSATSAPMRLGKIRDSMASARYNLSPQVKEFGITVSEQPQQIQARVLEPPTLEYAQGVTERVVRGVWRGTRFQAGVGIRAWTIICMDRRTDSRQLDNLEKCLISSGRKFGVNIGDAIRDRGRDFLYIEENYRNPMKSKQELIDYFKSKRYDLTVVVVPDNSKSAYPFVKQAAEIAVGRLTQCVRARTVSRLNPTTTDNIMLKINAKLDGVNHILSKDFQPSCFKQPIVIMGADVTHPSPDAQNIPSVAAVTCSYDLHGFKYIFSWRLQEPKLEIIKDLEAIVMEQLRYYKEKNKCEPLRIIFFRDGVSDGQFAEVRSSELRSIRNACSKLNKNYKPKISFFVVQKRHHTRLFPVNERDSEDKNLNVPAGTCVDTMITRPTDYDFYLVSHASIQGVAKPTKYFPLWDDANMSEDEIQQLAYYLCHLFARCNRSVSYPTPTYYAHLAAARAKVYIEQERIDMANLERLQARLQVQDSIIRQLPMYFV